MSRVKRIIFWGKYSGKAILESARVREGIVYLVYGFFIFFVSFFVSTAEAATKSVSSISVGAQAGTLTYGTPATATFLVTVTITGNGQPPAVTLAAAPFITGVTYTWYDSSNTTTVLWPQSPSATTSYTLRVSTSASAGATAGTILTVTDAVSALSGTGTLNIDKATPTLSVTNSPVVYNASPQSAVVSGSVAGIASNILYNGSATVPTNAGTYAITADFSPTDSTNYNSLSNASAADFTISKATPTLSVTNSPVVYDASPQSAVVSGSVAGIASNILYNGSATVPTNAGTYAITADFSPTDSTNYNSLSNASAGDFVIRPYYIVTPSTIGSGSVYCDPVNVSSGGSFQCTVTPGSGYHIQSLVDNAVDVTAAITIGGLYSVNNVTADHNITATFQQNSSVLRLHGTFPYYTETWYSVIQNAYDQAFDTDWILSQAVDFPETLDFNLDISIILQGGYDTDFTNTTGSTQIRSLTISRGTVTVGNIAIIP